MFKILTKIFLCGACVFPWAANADVNIAVVAPLAGDYENLGKELVSGARIAVNEINHNGGLNGEKINLVVVDDQCNDTLAVSTAQMIAVNSSPKDKMNLVIGPYCQNALKDVAAIYAKAKKESKDFLNDYIRLYKSQKCEYYPVNWLSQNFL